MEEELEAKQVKKKKRKKDLSEIDLSKDIRYRGPLSERAFRIFGWICISFAQMVVLMNLAGKVNPEYVDKLATPKFVLENLRNLSLPFLLLANFALILNNTDDSLYQVMKYGIIAFAIAILSEIVVFHFLIGSLSVVIMGTKKEAIEMVAGILAESGGKGFFSYNIFMDLFLCSLVIFFMNYQPKKFFTGKLHTVFRLFTVLPIAYELLTIVLKYRAAAHKLTMPLAMYPFLPVKPPMTFIVFIVLAIFVKSRELKFRKTGRSLEEYHQFLQTNRNSFQFSVFAAIILAVASIIDIIIFLGLITFDVVNVVLESGEEALEMFDIMTSPSLALGFGDSVVLIMLSPLMLLFSYTRVSKNKLLGLAIPFMGMVLVLLVTMQGLYQILKIMPIFTEEGLMTMLDSIPLDLLLM